MYQSGRRSGSKLYLSAVDQPDATLLRGGDGARNPFFSHDGEWVGFHDLVKGKLSKVSVLGGPPVAITDVVTPIGVSWGPDDMIVFASVASRGLLRVPAAGGDPEVLTSVDTERGESGHFWPEVLPNGNAVLFTAWSGSAEASRIAVVSLATGEVNYLFRGGSNPRYSPTGHIVYGVDGDLACSGL